MTTGIAAIQTNASVSFLSGRDLAQSTQRISQQPSTIPSPQASGTDSAIKEDTVQLSATTQRYLQSSQTQETKARGLVAQLVQAAAAGDTGALSLLTVI